MWRSIWNWLQMLHAHIGHAEAITFSGFLQINMYILCMRDIYFFSLPPAGKQLKDLLITLKHCRTFNTQAVLLRLYCIIFLCYYG